MTAQANSAVDTEKEDHGVTIAARGYDIGTDEQMLVGTEHIIVDGKPLCGNHHVVRGLGTDRYGTETTCYPLNGYDTCQRCGSIYVKRYSSEHDLFERIAEFEKGDWVEIEMADGSTQTGRVRSAADTSDFPSRHLRVVVSDEPQQRWAYGVKDELTVRVAEGESPVICCKTVLEDNHEEKITDITSTAGPADTVDDRTEATLAELEEIAGKRAKNIMTMGADRHKFHVNATASQSTEQLWQLLSDFHQAGYEITDVTLGERRLGTDCAAISLHAESLVPLHKREFG